jgi:heptosyltransferase I
MTMRVLIVKTSSMGDVLHTLPALTEAGKALGNVKFDWVVEESFAEIPSWHPLVDRVIPVAWRRWRKHFFKSIFSQEFKSFVRQLRQREYDVVIDAQGLIKSAVFTRLARGKRVGLDKQSLWEPLARFAYKQHCAVNPDQHAVMRIRQLFSQALGYSLTDNIDYGLDKARLAGNQAAEKPYVLFIHGTTWKTKLWPEVYWQALANKVVVAGYAIQLPWGNAAEKQRAERIAQHCQSATVLAKMNLSEIAKVIVGAKAVVAVDTGLGHLSAAFAVPTISLYGPTNPGAIGTIGPGQIHLNSNIACDKRCRDNACVKKVDIKPACFASIDADCVFSKLSQLL